MTIKEVLAEYYDPNPIMQAVQSSKLKADFKTWSAAGNGLELIRQIVLKYDYTFNPESVCYIFELFGVTNYDQLVDFIAAHKDTQTDKILDILDVSSDIFLGTMQTVDRDFVYQKISSLCNNVTMMDNKYQLFPEVKLSEMIDKCPTSDAKYKSESHDCENFAIEMRAWLSKQGYGNVTVGYCEYSYEHNETTHAHAVNIALTDADNIYLIEPQSDTKFKHIDNMPFNSYEEKFRIRRIDI